jgi:hypothetical protein
MVFLIRGNGEGENVSEVLPSSQSVNVVNNKSKIKMALTLSLTHCEICLVLCQNKFAILVSCISLSVTNSSFMRHKIKQICHFSSFSIFCVGCKTISRRAARRLIVLHRKQNIESELNGKLVLARCQANIYVCQ